MYRLLLFLSQAVVWITMKRHISGQEQTPREGGLLIVSNHLGLLDPLAIATRLPRRLYILAKVELFSWPIIGRLARSADVIPIRRGQSDREALRRVLEHLEAGHAVLVFPEGTYPKADEPRGMLKAQPGTALLALRSGATILPVGLSGAEMVWSVRGMPWSWLRRWPVTVRVGAPFRLKASAGASQKQALALATEEMMRRIAALVPEEYQGHYRDALSTEGKAPVQALPAETGDDAHTGR